MPIKKILAHKPLTLIVLAAILVLVAAVSIGITARGPSIPVTGIE